MSTQPTPPPQELFEMFQRMVNPMSLPLQNLLFPSPDVEEIDKKIADLKAVQNWLNANASMLELTIKTLEYQRVVLSPVPHGQEGNAEPPENPFANPALWPWMMGKGDAGKRDTGKK
jgi:hypothetical protein